MSLPSGTEARLVSLELSFRELAVGDEIGPADITQPSVYMVVGVPEWSTEDRFAARVPLALQVLADDSIITPRPRRSDTVFVRRYYATVTVTRAGGAVDVRKPKVWLRPVGDGGAVTVSNPERLKLQPGDSISLVAA